MCIITTTVCYRPQRSWGQGNVFYRCLSFILFTGGVSGEPPGRENLPGGEKPPPGKENPKPPNQAYPPPAGRTLPRSGRPPRDQGQPPPRQEDCSIRSMSGRYASYWNAFLLNCVFVHICMTFIKHGTAVRGCCESIYLCLF